MSGKKRGDGFGTKRERPTLQNEIEIISDRKDEDVLPYVDNFMAQMQTIKPMEEISLLTQEDAKQAINMIDETLRQLNQRLGIARSLKQILDTKQRS